MVFSLAMQVAVDEIFPNKDPLYLMWLWRNVLEGWGWMLTHPAESLAGMALFCFVVIAFRMIKKFVEACAVRAAYYFGYCVGWVGTLPGIRHIRKWLGDRTMRREMFEKQSAEWVEEICDIGQSKVAAGEWTQTQAKEWYAIFSKHLPILRYAATHDDTQGDLKETILERMRNEDRDVDGKIVPIALPA